MLYFLGALLAAPPLLLAGSAAPADLEPILVTGKDLNVPLGRKMVLLEDPAGELTIEDVSKPSVLARFEPGSSDNPSFRPTSSAYWVHFRLKSAALEPDDWYVWLWFPNMHYIDFFEQSSRTGKSRNVSTGSLRPYSSRDIDAMGFAFAVKLEPGEEKAVWIRFKSESSMTLSLSLLSEPAFSRTVRDKNLVLGLVYGLQLAILVVVLIAYATLKERNLLWFALVLTVMLLLSAAYLGFGSRFLWREVPQMQRPVVQLLGVLVPAILAQFSWAYLKLETGADRCPALLRTVMVISGAVYVGSLLFGNGTSLPALHAWLLLGSLLITISVGRECVRGASGWGLFIALICFQASLDWLMLAKMGFLESSMLLELAGALGSIFFVFPVAGSLIRRSLSLREQHQENLNRLGLIAEHTEELLMVLSSDGTFLYANPAHESVFRVPLPDLIGRPITDLVDHGSAEWLRSLVGRLAREGAVDLEVKGEVRNRSEGSHSKILEMTFRGFQRANDRVLLGVAHNVTDERLAEERKTQFFSTAAHELRAPLTSIQGFSEILLHREDLEPEKKRHFLNHIHRQSTGLTALVNDLLDLARIENGEAFGLQSTQFNLWQIVREQSEVIQAGGNGPSVVCDLSKDPMEIVGDREKIGQVLRNLFSNAVKYSPRESTIEVTGGRLDGVAHLSISDHGIGMTKAQVARIFDRFYRADSTDNAPSGTGLGMTIVKVIIDSHGGTISVESQLGVGTTVEITLPLATASG